MTHSASIRPFSMATPWSVQGADRRKANRLLTCGSSLRMNFGGASASFGVQSFHQFFGHGTEGNPHQRISQQLVRHKMSMGESNLMRTQKNGDLRQTQIPKAADYVAEAAEWAAKLTKDAEQTHGSKEAALEAVARKTGVNHSTLWSLRYRKPKDIAVSIYMKLKGAYERELIRQKGLLQHELEITRQMAGDCDAVRKAQAVLDALDAQGR